MSHDGWDRQPPYSAEAELAVLGGMLLDTEAVEQAQETVLAEMFYREGNRRAFRAMVRIFERGAVIDPVTLAEELRGAGDLEAVGGLQFIASVLDAVPTAANIRHHAEIVRDRWRERRLIEAGTNIVRLGYDASLALGDRVSAAEAEVLAVADTHAGGGPQAMSVDLLPTVERLMSGERGVLSGLDDVDALTNGFQRKTLYIIAARPSMGKSSWCVGAAVEAAVRQRKRVLFFSTEAGEMELAERAISYEGAVNLEDIRVAYRSHTRSHRVESAEAMVAEAWRRLHDAPFLRDCTAYTAAEMLARARRVKRDYGVLDLVVVDHVHEMRGPGDNDEQMIGRIGKDLKRLAKELDVPVVAAAQLNRNVEGRSDKRPMMSDLRGSGGLEEAADFVGLLHRPEYYHGPSMEVGSGKDKSRQDLTGLAELIVAKFRNGRTDNVQMYFRKECTRFENYSHRRHLEAA